MAEGGRLDPAVWVMTLSGGEKIHSFLAGFGPANLAGPSLGVQPAPKECAVTPAWRLITPFAIGTSIATAARTARATHLSAGIVRNVTNALGGS